MIYSMGPEAEKIFFQFGLADAEANDFHTVIGRFTLNLKEMLSMKELSSTKEIRKKEKMLKNT